jgi:hypothetical protein
VSVVVYFRVGKFVGRDFEEGEVFGKQKGVE